MKIFAALVLSFLALPVFSQVPTVASPDSFMGITYGEPISASVKECHSYGEDEMPCFKGYSSPVDPSVTDLQIYRRGAGSGLMSATQDAGGVYETWLQISAADLEAYRTALGLKFGNPFSEEHLPVQNAFGTKFTIDHYKFDTGGLVIELRGPDKFGGLAGSIRVTTKSRYVAEGQAKVDHAQKIGSDF